MESRPTIQSLLKPGEDCTAVIYCSLVERGLRTPTLFAVVNHDNEQAVFLFRTSGLQTTDIFLQRIVPVTGKFKATIRKGSSPYYQSNTDVTVDVITDLGHFISFELPYDLNSAEFIKTINQTSRLLETRGGLGGSFEWLSQYRVANSDAPAKIEPPVGNLLDFDEGGVSAESTTAASSSLSSAVGKDLASWSVFDASKVNAEMSTSWPMSQLAAVDRDKKWETPVVSEDLKLDSPSKEDSPFLPNPDPLALALPIKRENSRKAVRLRHGSSYIGSRLKAREPEYTNNKSHKIFCGTWNVNGQAAPESLFEWFKGSRETPVNGQAAPESEGSRETPDILAVGFQELDLSAEAFLWNDSSREEEWTRNVDISLSQAYRRNFYKLKSIRLVGMLLLIYVKDEIKEFIADVQAEAQGTGILGMMGNKGGVAIRFNLHNTSICFVNSHLAAHTDGVERRNQDFQDICHKISFTESRTILNGHDIVFWMGDLNYRLAGSSAMAEVKHRELAMAEVKHRELAMERRFEELLTKDQLAQQMSKHNVFPSFTEGPIKFAPTYKYNPGTDDWDSSEKSRAPAWCDRILWKGRGVTQRVYQSHNELRSSDHKPVSALFDVDIKVVDRSKKSSVLSELHLEMDKFENELKPVVKLNTLEFVFTDVKFGQQQSQELIIRNVGQSHADYAFKPPPNGDAISKDWLEVKPTSGFIFPNSEEKVTITVDVDKDSLSALNSDKESLENILVFHIENGADSFITIRGNFIPTCFGMPLTDLIGMHKFVRDIPIAKLIDHSDDHQADNDSSRNQSPLFVPKEVWLMVDYLSKDGKETEDLFAVRGLQNEVGEVVNALDTGLDVIKQSVHSVAEALLLFLGAMSEPVIPFEYFQKCLECCNNFTLCKQLLTRIPKVHKDLLKYLAAFLRELLRHSQANKLTAKTLASIFGSVCLRAPRKQIVATRKKQLQQQNNKKAAFFYHFLINSYDD